MGTHWRTVMVLLFGSCARALAEGNHHYSGLSSESEGIVPLVALAHNGTDEQKAHAAHALWSLARNDDDKVAISQAGGITPLVALARDGTDQEKAYATGALRNLAANAETNATVSRAYVRARAKSKMAGGGREGGVEANVAEGSGLGLGLGVGVRRVR